MEKPAGWGVSEFAVQLCSPGLREDHIGFVDGGWTVQDLGIKAGHSLSDGSDQQSSWNTSWHFQFCIC